VVSAEYFFSVERVKYEAKQSWSIQCSSGCSTIAGQIAEERSSGAQIFVHYNPDDPGHSVVNPDASMPGDWLSLSVVLLFIPAVISFIGVYFSIRGYFRRLSFLRMVEVRIEDSLACLEHLGIDARLLDRWENLGENGRPSQQVGIHSGPESWMRREKVDRSRHWIEIQSGPIRWIHFGSNWKVTYWVPDSSVFQDLHWVELLTDPQSTVWKADYYREYLLDDGDAQEWGLTTDTGIKYDDYFDQMAARLSSDPSIQTLFNGERVKIWPSFPKCWEIELDHGVDQASWERAQALADVLVTFTAVPEE